MACIHPGHAWQAVVTVLIGLSASAYAQQRVIEFTDGVYTPPMDAEYREDGFTLSVADGNHTETGPYGASVWGITPYEVYSWHDGGGNAVAENDVTLTFCGATFNFVGLDIVADPFNQNTSLPPFTIELTSSENSETILVDEAMVIQMPMTITVDDWENVSFVTISINDDPDCNADACRHEGTIDNIRVEPTDIDSDGDGIMDVADNCVNRANPSQRDTDGDGFGNVCDADLDNDGVVNVVDLGLLSAAFFSAGDVDADFNGDMQVNAIDLGIMKGAFFERPGPSCVGDL